MWNLPPPPGFQGLDEHKPVRVYHRHLPHWRQAGATYFVTFRLHDSLPQDKLRYLRDLKIEWERKNPPRRSPEAWESHARSIMEKVERWLDQGLGSCALRHPAAAALVAGALHHFDGSRYELDSYVIMPNHVHGIVRPLTPDTEPLERILQSWKRFTSRALHRASGDGGNLWQEESFDRIIRDAEHLYRAIQYIGRNPAMAGLSNEECIRWIRPLWVELGWRFER
jgi:REP element-mobilizing transposase RayT